MLALVLTGAGVGAGWGCADDVVQVPEELYGDPVCMWVADAHVYEADGSLHVIFDHNTSWTGAACLCSSEEEFNAQTRHEELNDMALQICENLADQYVHEWNDCQMKHDSKRWYTFTFWSAGAWEHPNGTALGCIGGR